jgi:hypothetical protein
MLKTPHTEPLCASMAYSPLCLRNHRSAALRPHISSRIVDEVTDRRCPRRLFLSQAGTEPGHVMVSGGRASASANEAVRRRRKGVGSVDGPAQNVLSRRPSDERFEHLAVPLDAVWKRIGPACGPKNLQVQAVGGVGVRYRTRPKIRDVEPLRLSERLENCRGGAGLRLE